MKRVATGLLLGSAWVLLLLKGPFWLIWLALTGCGVIALNELVALLLSKSEPAVRSCARIAGLLPLLGAASGRLDAAAAGLVLAAGLAFTFVVLSYSSLRDPASVMARVGLAPLYVGFPLAHLVLLANQGQGGRWLLYLSAITVASDTGAFCAGHLFGSRKLHPGLSPGKTVEGLVGGLAAGVAVAAIMVKLFLPQVALASGAAWGLTLAAVGVIGDLTESVLKRTAGVKDTGALLPGHGGILDRGDSILMAGPVLYYAVHFGWL